jgi:hypothetical protein
LNFSKIDLAADYLLSKDVPAIQALRAKLFNAPFSLFQQKQQAPH